MTLGYVCAVIITVLFLVGSMSILIDIYTDDKPKPITYNEAKTEPKSNYVYITEEDIVLAEPLLDDLDLEMDADLLE